MIKRLYSGFSQFNLIEIQCFLLRDVFTFSKSYKIITDSLMASVHNNNYLSIVYLSNIKLVFISINRSSLYRI